MTIDATPITARAIGWPRQCRRLGSRLTAIVLSAVGLWTQPGAVMGCVGDCNGNGAVAINELIVGVNIALGSTPLSSCPAFDANGDGMVGINELIAAVNNALNGCPA